MWTLHSSCIHLLRWSLKRSVKWTWTGSIFSTNESAWSVLVTGSQSRVWSGPKLSSCSPMLLYNSALSHSVDKLWPLSHRVNLAIANRADCRFKCWVWSSDAKVTKTLVLPTWSCGLSFFKQHGNQFACYSHRTNVCKLKSTGFYYPVVWTH